MGKIIDFTGGKGGPINPDDAGGVMTEVVAAMQKRMIEQAVTGTILGACLTLLPKTIMKFLFDEALAELKIPAELIPPEAFDDAFNHTESSLTDEQKAIVSQKKIMIRKMMQDFLDEDKNK